MTWMCNADSGVTFPVHLNFKRRFFRERMGNAQGGGGFPGGPPGGKKDGEKKKKKFESKGGPARVGRLFVGPLWTDTVAMHNGPTKSRPTRAGPSNGSSKS